MEKDWQGDGEDACGGGVLVVILGELVVNLKVDVSHQVHSGVNGTH